MTRIVTVTLDERTYEVLKRKAGSRAVGEFVTALIREQLLGDDLDAAYRRMAEDERRAAEALEWSEGTCGDLVCSQG